MHPNSRLIFEKHAAKLFRPDWRVLEVAPDRRWSTYMRAVARAGIKITDCWAANLDGRHRDDEHEIPMLDANHFTAADSYFDCILAGNVLEHVWQPWAWVQELARMLKPAGLLILIVPLNRREHRVRCGPGRRQDCWRIFPDGMRSLFENAGLETLLAAYEALDSGPDDRQAQFGNGNVYDTIGIGQKPL